MKIERFKRLQNGGPIEGNDKMPFMHMGKNSKGVDYYFDPYSKRTLVRDGTTGTYAAQANMITDTLVGGLKGFPNTKDTSRHLKEYPDLRGITPPKYNESLIASHKDYKNFMADYYGSADITRRLSNDGFNKTSSMGALAKRRKYIEDARFSMTDNGSHVSGNAPNVAKISAYDDEQKKLKDLYGTTSPRETILAHELGHTIYRSGESSSLGPNETQMLSKGFKNKAATAHDKNLLEVKADLGAMKYHFYKDGVFDITGKTRITPETLKMMKEKYKDNATFKRTFDNIEENTILRHLNDFTNAQPRSVTQHAAYGGPINPMRKRLRYGGPTIPYTLVVSNPQIGMMTPTVQTLPVTNTYSNTIPKFEGTTKLPGDLNSSHSKSKDRFRERATGGGIDPISLGLTAASTLVGGIAGSLNYKPTEGPETKGLFQRSLQAIAQNPIGGPLSIIPEVIKFNKERNTVVSGSPGSYAKGGPIDDYLVRAKRYNKNVTAQLQGLKDQHVSDKVYNSIAGALLSDKPSDFAWKEGRERHAQAPDIVRGIVAIPPTRPNLAINTLPRDIAPIEREAPNMYSKRNQMANGNLIPITEKAYNNIMKDGKILETTTKSIPKNSLVVNHYAKGGSVKRCATGGEMDEDINPNDADDQLSSNAFQVKGNPNVTDGNAYNINGSPVKLDHNEVIDTQRNFVFSDDLKIGKKSFADMAVKPNKAIGKAEKILQSNPYDEQAKKTIEFSNRNLGTIATKQEEMATLMGLRPEQPQALAAGGYYQGTPTQKIYNPFDPNSDPFNPYSPGLQIPVTTAGPIAPTNMVYPAAKTRVSKPGNPVQPEPKGPYNPGYVDPQMDVYVNQNTEKYSPVQQMNPLNMLQRSSTSYPTTNFTNPDGEVVNIGELGSPVTTSNPIQVASERAAPSPSVSNVLGSNTTTSNATDSNTNGMTLGDYLQFAEVGSKFFQTLRGPEVENQILDNTRITKNNYDVRPQLLQSQRSFQNQLNSIDSPSLNLRRSLANNLYASKLNADAGVISQYDNMNKQANTQYEQQLSGQRRYNIQSTQQTNNLNAANRGAYDSVVQNAYTSLGNLGESLNNRKTGQDSLKILAQRYPDVYKGLVEELFNKKKP